MPSPGKVTVNGIQLEQLTIVFVNTEGLLNIVVFVEESAKYLTCNASAQITQPPLPQPLLILANNSGERSSERIVPLIICSDSRELNERSAPLRLSSRI